MPGFLSSFAVNVSSGVTVTETSYLSPTDVAFGTGVTLGTATCTASGCTPSTFSLADASGTNYSVTEEYSISTLLGGETANSNIDVTDPPGTPIPGTLPLFASGLAGFWLWTRKRKVKAKLLASSFA